MIPGACRVLLTLGLATAAVTTAQAQAQDLDRERFNPILARVVKVEAVTDRGGYSLGSAIPVAPGRFITNCHVTANAVSIALLHEGLRWPVKAQRANLQRDLCLLDVPKLAELAPIPRGRAADLKVSSGVAAVGYTFGAGLSTQVGTVRALHAIDGGSVIQTATYFNSGASGGGLFTLDGRLVGILTFRLKGAEAYYFSVPVDWVEAELARDDAFVDIAPLPRTPPFWAQPVDRLPYFMRAATLQARAQWHEVLAVADDWARAEPDNAEPWFLRGEAESRLDQHREAARAYSRATELDPRFALAWYQLGETRFKLGELDAVRRIAETLAALDADLSAELRLRSGTRD